MYFSLFAGCGGFDIGFSQAGFKCSGALDIDKDACETMSSNLKSPVICGDVREQFDAVVDVVKKSEILIAGPPCQGFSTIGKREEDDPRNHLLPLVATVAEKSLPRIVVVENVTGAISGKHVRYWRELETRLVRAGYKTRNFLLKAQELGLPQRRQRVILLAWRTSFEGEIVFAASSRPRTLRDTLLLDGIYSNHSPIALVPGSRDFLIASQVREGMKLSNVRGGPNSIHTWDIPSVFGDVTSTERMVLELIMKLRRKYRTREFGEGDPVPKAIAKQEAGFDCEPILESLVTKKYVRKIEGAFDLAATFNGKYRRLAMDSVSPTVDTRFGQPSYFLHPLEQRGLSAREAARIQGFPDDYVFAGSNASQFRQIGNAVPPPMAKSIAKACRQILTT